MPIVFLFVFRGNFSKFQKNGVYFEKKIMHNDVWPKMYVLTKKKSVDSVIVGSNLDKTFKSYRN